MHSLSVFNFVLILLIILSTGKGANGQIMYQNVTNKDVALGSYGRVGINFSFDNGGSIGRRLNLNNMGSIGGRLEEQDYLEIAPSFRFRPKEGDSTFIYAQVRLAVYSVDGRLVKVLADGFLEAGPKVYIWDGRDQHQQPVASGTYFYRLESGDGVQTRAMTLIR